MHFYTSQQFSNFFLWKCIKFIIKYTLYYV